MGNTKISLQLISKGVTEKLKGLNHPFNDLSEQNKEELINLLLKGQAQYIEESFKSKKKEFTLIGLGTFYLNELKTLIAKELRKTNSKQDRDLAIDEIIKNFYND